MVVLAGRMFSSRWLAFLALLLVAISLTSYCAAQRGAITAPRNLVELTDGAELIVHGFVIATRSEPHPQLPGLNTVVVTLTVRETLKGRAPALYSFRQFIWDVRDRFDTAGYRKGQELLLMMTKPSAVGLSAPVGLEQGRFRIVRDSAGNRMAFNGHANAGLFTGMKAQVQARKLSAAASNMARENRSAIRSDELVQFVRELVEKK